MSGIVLMPDGSPAVDATVSSFGVVRKDCPATHTDSQGRFRLQGDFGFDCRLLAGARMRHARRPCEFLHSMSHGTSRPIELKLTPTHEHMVSVTAADKPVANAHVVAGDLGYKVHGVTAADGTVKLLIPSEEKLQFLTAWHPELGVAGKRDRGKGIPDSTSKLSLLTPTTHTIRVVDGDGKTVPDLELGVSVYTDDTEWIMSREIGAARVVTDAHGEATLRWFPRENIKYVNVDLFDPDWKREQLKHNKAVPELTTVPVHRKFSVQGRLNMPPGTSAEGIFVSGFGFGSRSMAIFPRAGGLRRMAPSRSRLPPTTAILWALATRSGLRWLDGRDHGRRYGAPAAITLDVYPATPLRVQVSRGPHHRGVANASVGFRIQRHFSSTDAQGKLRNALGGDSGSLQTDENGTALAGVGRGELHLQLTSEWDEQQTVNVKGDAAGIGRVPSQLAWQAQVSPAVSLWTMRCTNHRRASWSERRHPRSRAASAGGDRNGRAARRDVRDRIRRGQRVDSGP